MLRLLTTLLIVVLLIGQSFAADVSIKLTGGDVTGKVRGQGTANVIAEVTNTGSTEITGLRIAVYYSTRNQPPMNPESADWRIHEFIFEPALIPGETTQLSFTDENAAEYVLIESRYVLAGFSLSYNGKPAELINKIEKQNSVIYISTRDLVNLIGGGLGYNNQTLEVTWERQGKVVTFKNGDRQITVDGQIVTLMNKTLEIDGRGYVPLDSFCALFGIEITVSGGGNTITLSD